MLIDGKAIADKVRARVTEQTAAFVKETGIQPGLATVLVGDDPASHTYVRNKRKACEEVGIKSIHHELPATATQAEVEDLIRSLNENPEVHGILVQVPLPDQISEQKILDMIKIEKDADGFHPMNVGLNAMKDREPFAVSCTPAGVMVMLEEAGVELSGARTVVLGRSNIVGIPVALLLMHANATVTIAHSRTKDLPAVCREADVLIAAVGRAEMVKADWVKPGAVVIDVGINRIEDPSRKSGYRLVGDVATEEVEKIAKAISPVPGGVGPMTIAMLLQNTLNLARVSVKQK